MSLAVAVFTAVALLISAGATSLSQPDTPEPHRVFVAGASRADRAMPPCTWATVLSVTDGDTIRVLYEGVSTPVRYIGIDTPETVHPELGEQPFGQEAKALNSSLVAGLQVCLERDITERDKYNRLLRYVWLADGTLVQEAILAAGLAQVSTYPPDVKHLDTRLLTAQRTAAEAGIGIWGESIPSPTPTPSATPGQPGDCLAAYPTVCLPPPPPDLDCKDIPYRRFTVLAPDPHRFDGDGDGIGCES